MNGEQTQKEAPTTDQQFYRVELSATGQPTCQCDNCQLWTIAYEDSEPTEIGTSWQGADGKEVAQDICDLMNMAYDRGRESV
jgi:hypothetical protein